ncbi:MAG: hypothetical protein G3I10_04445 [Ferrovum sp.]|nr:hypothetical protein [Ferrovum sp.]
MTQTEGRAQFLQAAKGRLAQITAPALSLLLRNRIAVLAQVERQDVETLMGKAPAAAPANRARRVQRSAPSSLAARLLACVLHQPELVKTEGMPEAEAVLPDEMALVAVADFVRHHDGMVNLAVILEHFRGQTEEPFIQEALRREFTAIESSPTDQLALLFQEGLARLNRMARTRTIDALLTRARAQALTGEEKQLLQELTMFRQGK